jgi:pimeloyl-ACP methyl ester carboxylesterase
MLRQFAWLWLVFFTGAAAWQYAVRHRPLVAAIVLLLAFTIGPLGIARPMAVRAVFVGWMFLVFPIGWLVSHLVVALMFYALFTPLAAVFRPRPGVSTYWTDYPQVSDVRRYLRQY